ncbi:uncharacterized protein LOC136716089 [Amia ocellicauda]|uniref:uncharacterized protein LOC136716089 n=1 Tax=Amia ocellicauda TaxID=2972642 RepID=UPI003464E22E
MSQRSRRASMVFSWHKPFTILTPWRRGKAETAVESEVVLTKMKIFNNFQGKFVNVENASPRNSVSEQDIQEPAKPFVSNEAPSTPEQAHPNLDYLSQLSDLTVQDPDLPRLFKFESEDSGVELPSGANSPSTPTGSEQSFVVHSRGSSCDSSCGVLNMAAQDHLLSLSQCPETEETDTSTQQTPEEQVSAENKDELSSESATPDFSQSQEEEDSEIEQSGNLEKVSEEGEVNSTLEVTAEVPIQDTRPRSSSFTEAYDDMTEVEIQEQPLQKYNTSDSLDEYMDECCRLSEVNQGKVNALGSGLGYLEHICQLIEKIGQLQEHNLKLQKQICGLQKESRIKQTKEDCFLQHCSCGAASLAFQELKRHSRSEFHNLTASNGTLSDLSTIPEIARRPDRLGRKGVEGHGEAGSHPLVPLLRKGLNRRSYTEGEGRYLCDSMEGLAAPFRRNENHPWGRVKELVKKTRLRNQSRLGLSSSALKRSCPQLYRPDLGSSEPPRRDRNSMIALGHNTKYDYLWPH